MRAIHRNVLANQLLDVLQKRQFLPVHKRPSHPAVSRASGPTNAVHVRFGDVRNLKIDHVRKLVDVDAACGNVRGYQHPGGAVLEIAQGILAGRLALVAVDGLCGNTVFDQIFDHLVRAVLGAGEDQDRRHLRGHVVQQVAQQKALAFLVHLVDGLGNFFGRGGHGGHGYPNRPVQQHVGQLNHFRGHGRREKHRLAFGGQFGNDLLDVVDKAHVQHAVCLVQHKVREVAQVHVALAHKVQQAAGGGGHQIRALAQGIDLGLLAHAAKNNGVPQLEVAPVGGNTLVNLQGQLPGGRQNKHANGTRSAGFRDVHQVLQNGKGEGGGFSGSGLRRAQQVSAL